VRDAAARRRLSVRGVEVRRPAAVLLAGLIAAGCYRHVPVELAAVRPNEEVQVRVTEDAAARLVRELGTYTTKLDGRVARVPSDSVSVSVAINRQLQGMALEESRQTIFLGPSEVAQVRLRQFSRSRTVMVGVGAVVGFAIAAATIKQIIDPNPNTVELPGEPPPAPRIIRFQLPIF